MVQLLSNFVEVTPALTNLVVVAELLFFASYTTWLVRRNIHATQASEFAK